MNAEKIKVYQINSTETEGRYFLTEDEAEQAITEDVTIEQTTIYQCEKCKEAYEDPDDAELCCEEEK